MCKPITLPACPIDSNPDEADPASAREPDGGRSTGTAERMVTRRWFAAAMLLGLAAVTTAGCDVRALFGRDPDKAREASLVGSWKNDDTTLTLMKDGTAVETVVHALVPGSPEELRRGRWQWAGGRMTVVYDRSGYSGPFHSAVANFEPGTRDGSDTLVWLGEGGSTRTFVRLK